MKIEAGKFYKTRDGRKAGPIARLTGPDSIYAWTDGRCSFSAEGRFYPDQTHGFDLVEEWPAEGDDLDKVAAAVAEGLKNATVVPLAPMSIEEVRAVIDATTMTLSDPAGEPTKDIKTEIADEAKRIVSGARRSAYGKPEQNFERIARFWQAYFENTGRGAVNITAKDVSPLMRLMKEARLAETPNHRDSFVDLIGYTLTGAEVNGVKPA
jgi:hypothetical protein